MPPKPKTYVLIGDDQELAEFAYSKRDDVIVIRPQAGETLKDVAGKIKPPAHVILECHGGKNGTFLWQGEQGSGGRKWQNTFHDRYEDLFAYLPAGVQSITVGSCYGGTALGDLALSSAPAGCIVHSFVGSSVPNFSGFGADFAHEAHHVSRAIDYYLEALDAFDPKRFTQLIRKHNARYGAKEDENPEHALPRVIGVAGYTPHYIDMDREVKTLAGGVDSAAMGRAVRLVQSRLDVASSKPGFFGGINSVGPGGEAEEKLDAEIAVMAAKLQKGYVPKNVEERRIAYAIAAAYLHESGKLQQLVERSPGYLPPEKLDAFGRPIHAAVTPGVAAKQDATHVQRPVSQWEIERPKAGTNITENEQGYLDSVEQKLKADPQVKRIIADLRYQFSKTAGDDAIDSVGGARSEALERKGVKTKSWTESFRR